jgi:ankyrin repeat protein
MGELVNYREPIGGNQALHFAAIHGNKSMLRSLLKDYGADPKSCSAKGLSILHCAAQSDRGILTLVMCTSSKFEGGPLSIHLKDNFGCTPLHFAVLNKQFKCVEYLLGIGSNPND